MYIHFLFRQIHLKWTGLRQQPQKISFNKHGKTCGHEEDLAASLHVLFSHKTYITLKVHYFGCAKICIISLKLKQMGLNYSTEMPSQGTEWMANCADPQIRMILEDLKVHYFGCAKIWIISLKLKQMGLNYSTEMPSQGTEWMANCADPQIRMILEDCGLIWVCTFFLVYLS